MCFMILPYYLLSIQYFASFTNYEEDIFEVIPNMHVQGSKFGGKITNSAENQKKKVELHGVHGVSFFQVCHLVMKTIFGGSQ